jgi:signal transduction histidine kinase
MLRALGIIFSRRFWGKGNKYLVYLFFIILISVGALFYKTYFDSKNQLSQDLKTRIDLISKSIRPFELNNLTASSVDLDKKEYKDLKFKLESIRSVSSDLRFIYVVKERDGKVYFVADSEPDYSTEVSPAGQEYTEADPVLVDYIKNGSKDPKATAVIANGYTDRWGKWISVYAPIRDENGRYFIIAADLDYKKVSESLFLNLLIISTISIFLLAMILGAMYVRNEEEEILKSKTTFVSLASHELRTPLTGVRWTTENLLSSKDLSDADKKSISSIHNVTVNLIGLVSDFLDYITVDGLERKVEWKSVAVVDLLKKSIENLKSSADERGIHIITKGFEHNHNSFVLADETRIYSAFNNLISNAIKYSKDDGKVDVDISCSKRLATVIIKDNGIGIKKSDQEKIFEGMYRTDEAKNHTKQGTGLGLSFVKKVILMHKGSITLNSKPGLGTEIKITLPLNKNNL